MDIFQTIAKRIRKNSNKQTAINILYAMFGGAVSRLLPTMVQGLSQGKINMSGWKGTFFSFLGTTFIGFALDKPQMAIGSFAVESTKILYAYGNDTIASILGTPIVAFDENAIMPAAQATNVADTPEGTREITAPDGRQILVQAGPTATENLDTGVNDYVNTLGDYVDNLNTLGSGQNSQTQVGDYVATLEDRGSMSIEEMLNNSESTIY